MDVVSPMPAKVLEVLVSVGDQVQAEQEIVLLESMKMEMPVTTPVTGIVEAISVVANESVDEGQLLIVMAPI